MLLAAALVMLASGAGAVDQPVAGYTLRVGQRGRARFVASSTTDLQLPAPGSSSDPTLVGARLDLFDTRAGGAGAIAVRLGASGWTGLGSPAGSRGYRYRGGRGVPGQPRCQEVVVTQREITAACTGTGAAVPLLLPFTGAAALTLTSGDGHARYCAQFGGQVRRNDIRGFRADGAPAPAQCAASRPNILVINLDDTRFDGTDRMPALQNLAAEGVSFSEAFTPNAVCTASRASLLTGLYSLHHGTRAATGPIGGADSFRVNGSDQRTIAVWLHDAGYATALFGKYLNDYSGTEATAGPGGSFYLPPGWDRWRAFVSPEHYGGVHGATYEVVDEARARTVYDDHGSDAQYATDVQGGWVRDFVAESVQAGRPFFIYWAPPASHGDIVAPAPAARHVGAFAGLPLWRPPSWNEADTSDKPRWVDVLPRTPFLAALTDQVRQAAYESLLSVDEQLAAILAQLDDLGVAEDTVVILTSDNGSSWGEHRLWTQGKACPYEECQRVPMVVRYPRGGAGGALTFDTPVLNLDLAPTLADLARVRVPVPVDGASFAPWLRGDPPPPLRADYLLEHWRDSRNASLIVDGQVSDGDRLRVYYGDPRATPRASRLFELDAGDGVSPGAVAVAIGATASDSLLALRQAFTANVPDTTWWKFAPAGQIILVDLSPGHDGVYIWEEVDQGNVLAPANTLPDYYGVRDVAGGYTYVENEVGEVELYDLNADPWQLDNKAADPAYAARRTAMAARLQQLRP